jgi:hypothetical protein
MLIIFHVLQLMNETNKSIKMQAAHCLLDFQEAA